MLRRLSVVAMLRVRSKGRRAAEASISGRSGSLAARRLWLLQNTRWDRALCIVDSRAQVAAVVRAAE